jgi:predicted transcriptional regulator
MRSEDEDFCWGAPAARFLHPVRIQIVESIRRAGRPLSIAELADSLGGRPAAPRVANHLHRLKRLGIVAPVGGRRRGSALLHRYRLDEDD